MATNTNYSVGCGVCLGVFHIIFGIASVGSGISAIVYGVYLYHIGVAVWAGIFFILTGVFGLASGTRNNAVIAVYYAMSCISVFASMSQMGVYSYTIYTELTVCNSLIDYNGPYFGLDYYCPNFYEKMVLCGTACLVGFLEWIMAMSSACASCSCCCGSRSEPPPAQTVLIHAMNPMMPQAPQQTYYGQPGCSMPLPGQGPHGPPHFQQAPQTPIGNPFAAGPVVGAQHYVNPTVDVTPAPRENSFAAGPVVGAQNYVNPTVDRTPTPKANPFAAGPVVDAQDYVNPTIDLTPEAGARLPNMTNTEGFPQTLPTAH